MAMFESKEATEAEAKKMITRYTDLIHRSGLSMLAIFTLECTKPLASFGGTVSRFLLSPILPVIGIDIDRYISFYEKQDNIENMLKTLVEKIEQDKLDDKKMKDSKAGKEKVNKKSWRRFLPF